MVDAYTALSNRFGKGSRERQINRHHSRRSELGIEGLDKFQVHPPLRVHIQVTLPGEVHGTGGRNIRVVSHQVKLVDFENLAGNGKPNRTIVVESHVLDSRLHSVEPCRNLEFAGSPQGPDQVHFAVRTRMPGHAISYIDPQEGIHIELAEPEVNIGEPVAACLNVSVDFQICLFKLRLSGNLDVRTLGNSLNRKVACALLIQSE